ncbi:Galactose mutarotase-like superfamily protein isoform 1 [Cinnamomum micranthum f. kanehirae]|uniref:Galactose mutarotase-like superfamily protein isoform 1 n=1 Tax=Cinnamomum micranthum f. kanehirae TaxID=337451 RepID=A0A3S3NMF1_9MAGN|nr:Galactose mutarotase-like superfamily protein isoform 1 [Cinnamomum micranthum f. kanehirae]
MLCVEAAAIEKPITLKPGEEWRGRQELCAVQSSYCSGFICAGRQARFLAVDFARHIQQFYRIKGA